jgi:aspartate racemase
MAEPVVGIIGGMGPEATLELMRRIIAATPANDDADHIRLLIDNNPKIPSRIRALIDGDGDDPGPVIARVATGLEASGADFLVMPCHTAHHYWPQIAAAVHIPVWHMPDLSLRWIRARFGERARIGLLCSPMLRQLGHYEARLTAPGNAMAEARLLYPSRQDALLGVIRAIKANRHTAADLSVLGAAAADLALAGADVLLLGCTEFSVVANAVRSHLPIIDPLQVLAEDIVAYVKHGKDTETIAHPPDS